MTYFGEFGLQAISSFDVAHLKLFEQVKQLARQMAIRTVAKLSHDFTLTQDMPFTRGDVLFRLG